MVTFYAYLKVSLGVVRHAAGWKLGPVTLCLGSALLHVSRVTPRHKYCTDVRTKVFSAFLFGNGAYAGIFRPKLGICGR